MSSAVFRQLQHELLQFDLADQLSSGRLAAGRGLMHPDASRATAIRRRVSPQLGEEMRQFL